MRVLWISKLVLLLTVLSGPVIAGQPASNETEGAGKEPECDYAAVPNSF
jgi:hypothetical protein